MALPKRLDSPRKNTEGAIESLVQSVAADLHPNPAMRAIAAKFFEARREGVDGAGLRAQSPIMSRSRGMNGAREAIIREALATPQFRAVLTSQLEAHASWRPGLDTRLTDHHHELLAEAVLGAIQERSIESGMHKDDGRLNKAERRHGVNLSGHSMARAKREIELRLDGPRLSAQEHKVAKLVRQAAQAWARSSPYAGGDDPRENYLTAAQTPELNRDHVLDVAMDSEVPAGLLNPLIARLLGGDKDELKVAALKGAVLGASARIAVENETLSEWIDDSLDSVDQDAQAVERQALSELFVQMDLRRGAAIGTER